MSDGWKAGVGERVPAGRKRAGSERDREHRVRGRMRSARGEEPESPPPPCPRPSAACAPPPPRPHHRPAAQQSAPRPRPQPPRRAPARCGHLGWFPGSARFQNFPERSAVFSRSKNGSRHFRAGRQERTSPRQASEKSRKEPAAPASGACAQTPGESRRVESPGGGARGACGVGQRRACALGGPLETSRVRPGLRLSLFGLGSRAQFAAASQSW